MKNGKILPPSNCELLKKAVCIEYLGNILNSWPDFANSVAFSRTQWQPKTYSSAFPQMELQCHLS
jgi:hypothetical protein